MVAGWRKVTICSRDDFQRDDLSRNVRIEDARAPLTGIPTWTKTINTERFHKREQQKRDQYRTPGSKGVAHDLPDALGCFRDRRTGWT